MTGLWEDLRYAFTGLRRSPGWSAVVIATMALVIGINTAAFSLALVVFRQDPPFANHERLLKLKDEQRLSPALYRYWREHNASFEAVAASVTDVAVLKPSGTPRAVKVERVAGDYFNIFAAERHMGRPFSEAEAADMPAAISHRCWQRDFGGDPGVIGASLELDGRPFTVAAVLAPAATARSGVDVYVALTGVGQPLCKECRPTLAGFGLLRPEVSVAAAESELQAFTNRLAEQGGVELGPRTVWHFEQVRWANPAEDGVVAAVLVSPLLGYLFLFVGWANLATHFLGQAVQRRQEIAARISVGSSRWRIIRMLLVESVTLSALGTAAGLLLAQILLWCAPRWLPALPARIPDAAHAQLDVIALIYTSFLSAAAAAAVGLAPAVQLSRVDLNRALKEGDRSQTGSRATGWLRGLLVGFQVAVAVMVSSITLYVSEPGAPQPHRAKDFFAETLIAADLELAGHYPTPQAKETFAHDLLKALTTRPGTVAAAVMTEQEVLPAALEVEGGPRAKARRLGIAGDYFAARGIALVAGKPGGQAGLPLAAGEMVVNETFARRFFGTPDIVGRRLRFAGDDRWSQVVAVAADMGRFTLGTAEGPVIFVPFSRFESTVTQVLVRSTESPEALLAGLRKTIVERSDGQLPVSALRRYQDVLLEEASYERIALLTCAALAAVILLIAVVGLKGVVAFQVAGRARELGIRMALGATPLQVVGSVLAGCASPLVGGTVLGLTGFIALAVLFGLDPLPQLGLVLLPTLLVLAVAFSAALLPAMQIGRRDPMLILRRE